MSRLKSMANRLRYNRHISNVVVWVARPIQRASAVLEQQLRIKVWRNGGTVNYDGVMLSFPPNVGVNYASTIFWNGVRGYEPETWRVLRPLLENAKQFMDIGSNIGFYAVLARKINPQLQVDAFEPMPGICDKNRQFHLANGLDSEHVWQVALGSTEGQATLFVPSRGDDMEDQMTATLRQDSWQARGQDVTHLQVKTWTLDSFCRTHVPLLPLVLKIDVEDFEYDVLRGGAEVLQAMRPWIICEILGRKHGNVATAKLLESLRYSIFAISREGLFRIGYQDLGEPRSFTNFVLIPSEWIDADKHYLALQALGRLKN